MICRVKYIGKSFGVDSLTNNKIYDVLSVESLFIKLLMIVKKIIYIHYQNHRV